MVSSAVVFPVSLLLALTSLLEGKRGGNTLRVLPRFQINVRHPSAWIPTTVPY
jgi:hypothetical protein